MRRASQSVSVQDHSVRELPGRPMPEPGCKGKRWSQPLAVWRLKNGDWQGPAVGTIGQHELSSPSGN